MYRRSSQAGREGGAGGTQWAPGAEGSRGTLEQESRLMERDTRRADHHKEPSVYELAPAGRVAHVYMFSSGDRQTCVVVRRTAEASGHVRDSFPCPLSLTPLDNCQSGTNGAMAPLRLELFTSTLGGAERCSACATARGGPTSGS